MIYITGEQVMELLDMESCIKLMSETLSALSKGEATQVLRTAMKLQERNILGLMPSAINSKNIAGTKIITIFPENFNKGLPSHQGVVIVFETETGSLKALVEGEAITAIRTAAVSAVATDMLSNKNSKVLAILGSGLQARKHLEAIKLVRNIEVVKVWDINMESASRYSKEMSKKFKIPVVVCETSEEAVRDADIICTLTAAREPILFGSHVKKGAHVNAVGACTPNCRELDTELIKNCKLYSDCIESTVNEAGDYLIPLEEGAINREHIQGELGDVILGKISKRENEEDITVFKALGLAVEDLAAADFVLNRVAKMKGDF
jgi:ornithine cyclodeaminase/alanine dehydrogenase-like protein (mu-crystallin family)